MCLVLTELAPQLSSIRRLRVSRCTARRQATPSIKLTQTDKCFFSGEGIDRLLPNPNQKRSIRMPSQILRTSTQSAFGVTKGL